MTHPGLLCAVPGCGRPQFDPIHTLDREYLANLAPEHRFEDERHPFEPTADGH